MIRKIFRYQWFFIIEFLLINDRSEDSKKIWHVSRRTFVSMKGSSIPVELDEHTAYYNLERHSDCIIVWKSHMHPIIFIFDSLRYENSVLLQMKI